MTGAFSFSVPLSLLASFSHSLFVRGSSWLKVSYIKRTDPRNDRTNKKNEKIDITSNCVVTQKLGR